MQTENLEAMYDWLKITKVYDFNLDALSFFYFQVIFMERLQDCEMALQQTVM